MKCYHCQTEINHVYIYSECVQKVSIDEFCNATDYESPEVLEKTLAVECPECQESLMDIIKE